MIKHKASVFKARLVAFAKFVKLYRIGPQLSSWQE